MTTKTLTRSFAGGERTELLFGRLDLGKFQTGLALCKNFIVTAQGPIVNRPGFEFVRAVKNSAFQSRLIPFTYSSTQTMVIEISPGTFRFHTQGATLLSGGVPYEVANPYMSADIFSIHYVQSADVLTLVHPNYPPKELRRLSATNWVLSNISFVPTIATPAIPSLTSKGTGGSPDLKSYVTTAVAAGTFEESLASPAIAALIDLSIAGNYIEITPAAVPNAIRYQVYKLVSGLYGYIGQTNGAPFLDNNIAPDISRTPQLANNPFSEGSIVSVPVTAGGTNYGTAVLSGGVVLSATVTDGGGVRANGTGSGYNAGPPTVTATGGGGTGAAFTAVITDGPIIFIQVSGGGAGYISAPTVTNTGGGGTGATFSATVDLAAGTVTGVAVTNGGSGYNTNSGLVFTGGGFTTVATATTRIAGKIVSSVTVTSPGTNYSAAPTLAFTGGGGTGAAAYVNLSNVLFATPTLAVTGGAGSNAILDPVVVGGIITAVRITSSGSGYAAPVVTFSSAAGGSGATFGTPILTGATNYPGAVSYYEQRRVFAGSISEPQTLRMTRSGTESNLSYSIPSRSDDSITARIVAREANTIRHLVPLGDLLALTSGGEWRIVAASGGALTPSDFSVKSQGYVGASQAQPITTSNSVLFSQARGGRIRDLQFSWQQQGYDSTDVSILAPHLFDYKSITDLAYSKAPSQILWAVRNDGVLLGMTYRPEHEVKAWHQHVTAGEFESVAVVAEGEEDAVYVTVRRFIGGSYVRFVERMHTRNNATLEDSFFVDAGLTYTGAAAKVISGLSHLEGATVSILADGGVEPQQRVTGGAITLTAPASKVHIGLPYNADAQGMPLSIETAQALGQGAPKNINKAWLRVYQSSGLKVGPTFDKLKEYPQRSTVVNYGLPAPWVSGELPLNLSAQWTMDGQWCLRQSDPLPVTLTAITIEFASGG